MPIGRTDQRKMIELLDREHRIKVVRRATRRAVTERAAARISWRTSLGNSTVARIPSQRAQLFWHILPNTGTILYDWKL